MLHVLYLQARLSIVVSMTGPCDGRICRATFQSVMLILLLWFTACLGLYLTRRVLRRIVGPFNLGSADNETQQTQRGLDVENHLLYGRHSIWKTSVEGLWWGWTGDIHGKGFRHSLLKLITILGALWERIAPPTPTPRTLVALTTRSSAIADRPRDASCCWVLWLVAEGCSK